MLAIQAKDLHEQKSSVDAPPPHDILQEIEAATSLSAALTQLAGKKIDDTPVAMKRFLADARQYCPQIILSQRKNDPSRSKQRYL